MVVLPQGHGRLVRDLLDEPGLVPFGEGWLQGQQLVERRAQRIDIAQRAGDAPEPLGRHEPQCPDQVVRLRQLVPLDELGQPEVGDPDVPLGVEQEVGGLDVAVDHPLAVGVVQCVGDLGSEPGDLAEVDRLGLAGERDAGRLDLAQDGVEADPSAPAPRVAPGVAPPLAMSFEPATAEGSSARSQIVLSPGRGRWPSSGSAPASPITVPCAGVSAAAPVARVGRGADSADIIQYPLQANRPRCIASRSSKLQSARRNRRREQCWYGAT